jgi:hypothetical protein
MAVDLAEQVLIRRELWKLLTEAAINDTIEGFPVLLLTPEAEEGQGKDL